MVQWSMEQALGILAITTSITAKDEVACILDQAQQLKADHPGHQDRPEFELARRPMRVTSSSP
jgi:hypothetical protein